LDAVQRKVESLGGKASIRSVPGKGTTFVLELPLSVSMANLLLVQVGGELYGVPLHRVLLTTEYDLSARGGEGFDARSLVVMGELVRAYGLAKLFGLPSLAPPGPRPFVVMEVDGLRFAVSVDRLVGRLLGTSVDADLPKAQVAPRGAVARVLQPDGPSFAVHFTVEGGARLRWLLHFTEQGATLMGGLLLGQPVLEPLGSGVPMYTSALAEAANIVVSSYVGGVGAAVGVTLVPSIPHVEVGPLDGALQACFGDLDSALLL